MRKALRRPFAASRTSCLTGLARSHQRQTASTNFPGAKWLARRASVMSSVTRRGSSGGPKTTPSVRRPASHLPRLTHSANISLFLRRSCTRDARNAPPIDPTNLACHCRSQTLSQSTARRTYSHRRTSRLRPRAPCESPPPASARYLPRSNASPRTGTQCRRLAPPSALVQMLEVGRTGNRGTVSGERRTDAAPCATSRFQRSAQVTMAREKGRAFTTQQFNGFLVSSLPPLRPPYDSP
ncbi:hypothetical protein EI94DRAFT_709622 [Lactarius quietus]|nr:hypothetical protein EI94DRAFT_709622 [Lactarius quietus]